jgi:hypothetical protein
MPILNIALVILALVGMLALGGLLGRLLARSLEAEQKRRREALRKKQEAPRGRPDFMMPHGDTEIIDLVGWKRRAR